MKTKTKIVKFTELIMDKEAYPRNQVDWVTVYAYSDAMKTGAKFPPIKIAELPDGRMVVTDGWHRIKALIKNKETHFQAEIKKAKDMKDAYVEAVKSNISHGRPFSFDEKMHITARLKDLKFESATISEIVHVSKEMIDKHQEYHVKSMMTGKEFTGIDINKPESVPYKYLKIISMLNDVIDLLEEKKYPTEARVTQRLAKIYALLKVKFVESKIAMS